MNPRAYWTFLLVGILLSPLAWIVLNGPKLPYAEVAGGMMAIGWLVQRRQAMAWLRVVPALCCGIVYVACAYVVREPRDLFPDRAAILLLFYGFPTGLCLRRLAQDGQEAAVTWAMVFFSVAVAAAGIAVIEAAGAARILQEAGVGAEVSRSNGSTEAAAVDFLRFFSISNIIIGIIPFTVFGLSTFPVLLTARTLSLRMGLLCAIGIAAYVNFRVATRTTFAASALSSLIILPLVYRAASLRQRLVFGTVLGVMGAGAIFYATRNKDLIEFLANRFSEASSDSRLTIWKESIHILAVTPDGNGIRRLTAHLWAHNLFLDVGLANGWIALAAMMGICGCAFFFAWRTSHEPNFSILPPNVIMLGWLITGFIALQVLPPVLPLLAILFIGLAYFAPYRPVYNFPEP